MEAKAKPSTHQQGANKSQTEHKKVVASFKRRPQDVIEYRGCQVKDRQDAMKIRGFVPKTLAPNASDSQRDFTRQYGTQQNPGDNAKKEKSLVEALIKIDEALASAGA